MRKFDYRNEYKKLLTADIVALLTKIHEYKGKQLQLTKEKSTGLACLAGLAKIQSTDASNSIEGISTSNERLQKIVKEKTLPKTESEKEIAGYRDVLSTIHENYEYIPLRESMILQLHRDLYKFTGPSSGGSYKNNDNYISKEDEKGKKTVRFESVTAREAPEYLKAACKAFDKALHDEETDALVLIPMFVLDFLCIHPFSDGNGRMSRLLTLLLLYRAEYTVGKYVSMEKLIADSKETYYEKLQQSSLGWYDGKNDYAPFVEYMLGIIVAACREFETRAPLAADSGFSKTDRIREIVKNALSPVTKSEIMKQTPDVSQVTVQRTLNGLLKSGMIVKIGGGRYTKYVWNHEKE